MNLSFYLLIGLVFFPFTVPADVGQVLEPLPCGIYDQSVKPFVEKELETQNPDPARYSMEFTTKRGKVLSVEVKSVEIMMPGERNQVTVVVDGKQFAKTSHQDVPLYLEVHLDNEKYRIICVRVEPVEMPGAVDENAGVK